MAVIDLSPAGSQQGTFNGAIFTDMAVSGGGTGVLDSFVRISANTEVVEGYNSSFRPVEFDEDTSPVRNRDLPLADVPIVIIDGVAYREFLLDTNETNPGTLLSLNRVEVYQTNVAGITDYPFVGTATKIYDMDAGTAGIDTAPPSPDGNWILLNANEPAGSGTANMFMYVPNALFGAGQFVVLYSRFGETIGQDDGFEEWSVREADNVFSISGRKFNDLDGDHTDDGGTDPGLPDWTIYIDANDNGVRDAGEPFTTTGADGTYSLVGLAAGTYIVCEELQAGWQQTFPVVGDGCHTVIVTDADVTGIDFGNQLIAAAINIEKLVNGDDADTPPGPSLAVGSTATFTYLVTNPGNVPLANVVVVDDNGTPGNLMDDFMPMFTGGDTLANGLLDPGETWTYTATKIVTLGLFTNIGAVTGTFNQTQVTDNDPANHTGVVVAAPDVDIEKFVNGNDADMPTGPFLAVGSTANFTYLVTNTGNVALTNVSVVDDQGLMLTREADQSGNNDNVLDPGEVWLFTASSIVVAGQYTNLGTVTADSVQGQVSDSDPANYFGVMGGIDIEKLVEGQDADMPPGPGLEVGSTATFTYIVTNTGNVPLDNVTVIDDNGTPGDTGDDFAAAFVGGDTNMDGLLDLSETWTFSAIRVVTLGLHTNTGTATGETPLGTTVTDSDVANHVGLAPGIDIEKLVNGQDADSPTGPLLAVGSTATFTYLVTNTGDVPLMNVVVIDDNGTPLNMLDDFMPMFTGGDTIANGVLDPGETWTYTAARIVTAGQYTNFGTVIANSSQTVVSDADPANHFGVLGAVDIEKLVNGQDADSPTGPLLAVGSTATFTYLVTNTGNVALTGVSVVDDQGLMPMRQPDQIGNNDNVLDLGEVWVFTASTIVTPGQYTNIGTVTALTPLDTTVTDSDPANHFGVLAAVDIEKLVNGEDADSPTGPLLEVGSIATFTYLVTNTGNVALTGVSVVDDQGLMPMRQADQVGNNDNVLDVGEVWVFTASSIVVAGQYTNLGTVTAGSDQGTVTDSDPANYLGVIAGIDIEKLVNGQDADTPPGPILEVGSTVTFTYIVTNTGNVPLANVVVVDDNGTPGNLMDDFMPTFVGGDVNMDSLLDPTETWTYTAMKLVTLGQYTNVGTVTGETPQGTIVTDSDTGNFFGVPMIITPDKTARSLPYVHLVDPTTGAYLSSFLAYSSSYLGGVRVATGDITGDGIPEIITAPGRNHKPIVKIFSLDGTLLEEFLAYGATFKGGIDLAVGDVNNDGQNDIVTAMTFFGNQVKVFKNPNGTLPGAPTPFHSSFNFGTPTAVAKHLSAFAPFGTFKGGASVEVADMGTMYKSGTKKLLNTTLDGKPEIIVANEAGMRTTVYVYGYLPKLTASTTSATPVRVRTYLPFPSTYRGGISLDVAPVNLADDVPDIIVGAKSLGGSQVLVLNGASTSTVVLNGFVAFTPGDTASYNAPVNVTAVDQDGDGRAEFILASQGSDGSATRIRKFDSLTGMLVDELLEDDFDPIAVDHFFGAYFTETIKL